MSNFQLRDAIRRIKLAQKSGAKKVVKDRNRVQRTFPASSFEEALEFAKQIFITGSGKPVRRLTLFDHLGKAPESGASRQLITNASKYNLIQGSHSSEHLSVTEIGAKAVNEEIPQRERTEARVQLAIFDIEPFNNLYRKFVGSKLPARQVLIDNMKEAGVSEDTAEEAVDTFIVNLRFTQLLQTLSGAERIVSLEHLLDSLPSTPISVTAASQEHIKSSEAIITLEQAGFDKTCFYIAPIGDDGSDFRKHSDLFLGSIVEPALDQLGLKVVRADAIDKPGFITRQIIDYLMKSKLVVADLSFHNPNVFYELAIRHAARLPVVQIIRKSDRIPFDLNQVRTIQIDNSDIYSLVPKIETYRAEIANQVRQVLENPDLVDNPITTFYPGYRLKKDVSTLAN
jgi:hypothetical protein